MKRLTEKELDVMQVLWSLQKPLTVREITQAKPSLKVVTVQASLKNLIEKKFVKVKDIIQVNKTFAKTYTPLITSEDYYGDKFLSTLPYIKHEIDFSKGIVAALLNASDNEEQVIAELEEFIEKKKRELKQK